MSQQTGHKPVRFVAVVSWDPSPLFLHFRAYTRSLLGRYGHIGTVCSPIPERQLTLTVNLFLPPYFFLFPDDCHSHLKRESERFFSEVGTRPGLARDSEEHLLGHYWSPKFLERKMRVFRRQKFACSKADMRKETMLSQLTLHRPFSYEFFDGKIPYLT